jgi:hypothetical protein
MNQEALRSRLLIEMDCITLDANQVASALTPDQLAWRPTLATWGVGHILEHLIVTNDAYLKVMRGLIYARDAAHAENGSAGWEPTISGWILVSYMRSKWRVKAKRSLSVATPRDNVLAAFQDRQNTQVSFLRAAAALEWAKVRMASPVNRIWRLNLGDAFMVLTVHAQRHIKQMERVRDLPAFPA